MTSALSPSDPPPSEATFRARLLDALAGARRGLAVAEARHAPEPAARLARSVGLGDVVPDLLVAPRSAGRESPSTVLAVEIVRPETLDDALTRRFEAFRAADPRLAWLILDPHRAMVLAGEGAAFGRFERGAVSVANLGLSLSLDTLFAPEPGGEWPRGVGDLPLTGRALPRFEAMEDFLTWSDAVPGKQRLDLVGGAVRFARPYPQRRREAEAPPDPGEHALGAMTGVTHRLRGALMDALGRGDDTRRRERPRLELLWGLMVRAGPLDAFCPDLMLIETTALDRAGPDAVFVEPLAVIEVLTPETAARDMLVKAPGYLGVPSMAHVLLVDPGERVVLHMERSMDGAAASDRRSGIVLHMTRHRTGRLVLDDLGIDLDLDTVF